MRKAGTCVVTNAALFAFLFLSVSLNKQFVRPGLTAGTTMAIVSGSYSNFTAAWTMALLPACPVITKRLDPTKGIAVIVASALGVFAVLSIEEATSIFGASQVSDWHDVFASALGSLCAVLTFLILRRLRAARSAVVEI